MPKYKCSQGHQFDGDDFTLKCPECGTSDFNLADGKGPIGDGFVAKVIEFAKKYKYILIGVLVLILLIMIFSGGGKESVSYDVRPTAYYEDGYIIVNIKEYKDGTSKKIPFTSTVYNKFNFTINGNPVIWDHQDTIYICEQGFYELKWTHPSSHPYNDILETGGGCSRKNTSSNHKGSEQLDFSNIKNFSPNCISTQTQPTEGFGLFFTGNRYLKPNQSTTLTVKSNIKGRVLFYEWYKGKIGQGSIIGKDSTINLQPDASSLYSVRVYYKENNKVYADSATINVYVSDGSIISHPQKVFLEFIDEKFKISFDKNVKLTDYKVTFLVSYNGPNFTKTIYSLVSNEVFPSSVNEFHFIESIKSNCAYFYCKVIVELSNNIKIESEVKGPYRVICDISKNCRITDEVSISN